MTDLSTAIVALAMMMTLVALVPRLASVVRLPATVLLGVLGCVLGLAMSTAPPDHAASDLFSMVLAGLRGLPLNSEIILWVFLPIMLFEVAIGLDGRELLEEAGGILVMAIVAVLISTLVAGLLVFGVSGQSLAVCLMIAAIVATTDPSTVVSIFRDLGAPRRLTTLVEGESLLNDAAAIVLFTTIVTFILSPTSLDGVEVLVRFVVQFLGGIAFGALLGRIAAEAMGRLDRGGPAETTVSFATAYLAYAIGEHSMGVSGVVAVVAAGLVLGTVARGRLATPDWQRLRGLWMQLGFWASSLVIVLAATKAPDTLLSVEPQEFLPLLALIVGVTLARALTLFGVLPLVLRLQRQRPVDHRYKLVLLWGGLRGSVTLALAMAAAEHEGASPETRHLVEVLATGLVFFTLLVQGTTLGWLIRLFGLDRLSPVEQLLRERVLALTRASIRERISVAAIDHGLDLAQATELRYLQAPTPSGETGAEPTEEISMGQLRVALATVTARETELYLGEMALGMISRATGARLIRESTSLIDALRHQGVQGYRHEAKRQDEFDRVTRLAARIHARTEIGRPLARLLARRIETLLVRRRVLEALIGYNRQRIFKLFEQRLAETAEHVLEERLGNAERRLDAVRLQYPEHWTATASRYLARIAIGLEEQEYAKLHAEHLLSPEIHRDLLADLAKRQRLLGHAPRLDLGLDPATMMRRVPLFSALSAEDTLELAHMLRSRLAFPGERIIRRGTFGDAMYFIASGAVEVALHPKPVRLGTGDFFGEIAMLTGGRRTSDVVVLSYSRLLVLRRDAFRRFLASHPELVREVERVAEQRLLELHEGSHVSRETTTNSLADAKLREDPV